MSLPFDFASHCPDRSRLSSVLKQFFDHPQPPPDRCEDECVPVRSHGANPGQSGHDLQILSVRPKPEYRPEQLISFGTCCRGADVVQRLTRTQGLGVPDQDRISPPIENIARCGARNASDENIRLIRTHSWSLRQRLLCVFRRLDQDREPPATAHDFGPRMAARWCLVPGEDLAVTPHVDLTRSRRIHHGFPLVVRHASLPLAEFVHRSVELCRLVAGDKSSSVPADAVDLANFLRDLFVAAPLEDRAERFAFDPVANVRR